MYDLLVRKFIKNHENYQDLTVRGEYISLAGLLGVGINVFLFLLKLTVGILLNSIAIVSDAFNNLSDTLTSVVSIAGARMSRKPADADHPHGHGRFEYIASLVVSALIFLVGVELLRNSVNAILNPQPLRFRWSLVFILIASLFAKVYMYRYNIKLYRMLDSSLNEGVAIDSRNDVVATSAVIASILIGEWTGISIDGYAGFAVALLVLYSGYGVAKETISLLLGKQPDEAVVKEIEEILMKGKYVRGVHDLYVHDYGPGRIMASVHVEMPENVSLGETHAVVDGLEEEIRRKTGVSIVVHADPTYCLMKNN